MIDIIELLKKRNLNINIWKKDVARIAAETENCLAETRNEVVVAHSGFASPAPPVMELEKC